MKQKRVLLNQFSVGVYLRSYVLHTVYCMLKGRGRGAKDNKVYTTVAGESECIYTSDIVLRPSTTDNWQPMKDME